jgi:Putative antitoxin of bacterial toxin-antitoxin system, YdaS/YdaT
MSTLIRDLGGTNAVARILNIKPPSVSGWRGRPPPERCPELERAVSGRVTCEQMRPDVRWSRVPDADWPHPAGRPVIDPAGGPAMESGGAPLRAQQPAVAGLAEGVPNAA